MGHSDRSDRQIAAQEDRRTQNRILRQAEHRGPPDPDPADALEAILCDRRAGPAFLRWYREEILQFWEGHCHEA